MNKDYSKVKWEDYPKTDESERMDSPCEIYNENEKIIILSEYTKDE